MTAPIVRTESASSKGFAICIKDEDRDPTVLHFVCQNNSITYEQKTNDYWRENSLKVQNQEHLNYVLAIINNDIARIKQLSEESAILKDTVRLYDPTGA